MRARYLALVVLIASPRFAEASNVDWKFYGGADLVGAVAGEHSICFYDENGVDRRSDGHIRVWVKCLPQKDLDAFDMEQARNKSILEETGRRVASYYVPPVGRLEDLNQGQALTITGYEVIADMGDIKPQAQIFYELNCSERMLRELSMHIESGGKSGSFDKPRDWRYVPPETVSAGEKLPH